MRRARERATQEEKIIRCSEHPKHTRPVGVARWREYSRLTNANRNRSLYLMPPIHLKKEIALVAHAHTAAVAEKKNLVSPVVDGDNDPPSCFRSRVFESTPRKNSLPIPPGLVQRVSMGRPLPCCAVVVSKKPYATTLVAYRRRSFVQKLCGTSLGTYS